MPQDRSLRIWWRYGDMPHANRTVCHMPIGQESEDMVEMCHMPIGQESEGIVDMVDMPHANRTGV